MRNPPEHHIQTFRHLCRQLEGYTTRSYLSFCTIYGKVKKNFSRRAKAGWEFPEFSEQLKIQLAEHLADIAAAHGIQVYSCCNDFLVGPKVKKAHCIDAGLLARLFGLDETLYKVRSTRNKCGCYESTDIGTYGTCRHRCLYCYAAGSPSAR
ncbi:MAG: hypothetical protein PWQ41_1031 [Bacillota bacterium]|nr:hypothetical protein [Bacillota bacterium]MDK2925257.1 hypothetical protein [Bacillota bacterium]